MDLRHLRVFVTLAQERHFGRTAARLNTSQPVISRQLKELEAHVGVLLVERSARRVGLTHAGRLFEAEARAALQHVSSALDAARSGSGNGLQTVRLGLVIGAAQPFTSQLVAALQRLHPGVIVTLPALTERTLVSDLVERRIDAAVVPGDSLPARLKRAELGRVRVSVTVAEDHPLAKKEVVAFSDVATLRLILPDPQSYPMMHDTIGALARAQGTELNVVAMSDDILHMLTLVADGNAAVVGPAPAGLHLEGTVRRVLMPCVEVPFFLAWTVESRAVLALRKAISVTKAAASETAAAP